MNGAQAQTGGLERALRTGLGAALWVPLVVLAVQVVEVWSVCLPFAYQLDYGEAQPLHSALSLIRGQTIYPPVAGYPYVSTAYTPGYILLAAAGVRLTGPGFLVGRLISLLSGIAVAALAAAIVWRETRSRAGAALAAALIPSVGFVTWWMALMRVDMLALAFSMLGLLLALRGRYAVAAGAFAAALLTRQSAIAAPAAVLVALLLQRRWRPAARFALVLVGTLAVAFAALMVASGGWFYVHAFKSLAQHAWRWSSLLVWADQILAPWPALVAIGAAAAYWALRRGRCTAVALYLIISALISITSAKIGSWVNYFLEPFAAACVLIGLAYGASQRTAKPGLLARAAAPALSLLLTAQLVWMALGFGGVMQRLIEPFNGPASQAVVQRLRDTEGPTLCEDYGLLHLAGRPVLLQCFEFTQMVRAGLADPQPVLDDVHRGRFALIVMRMDPTKRSRVGPYRDLRGGRWYGPLVDEIRENYTLSDTILPYYLLVPK